MKKNKLSMEVEEVEYSVELSDDDYELLFRYDYILDKTDDLASLFYRKFDQTRIDYNPHFGQRIFIKIDKSINTIAIREKMLLEIEKYIDEIRFKKLDRTTFIG